MLKKIIVIIVLLVAVFYGYAFFSNDTDPVQYKSGQVDRGKLVRTISANGTLTPLELVEVGTQISGTVTRIYADFNDQVKTGQILAELDPALLNAQLQQSAANLKSAQTNLSLAINKLSRSRQLVKKGFISGEALDEAEQQLRAARAQVEVNQAQVMRDRANLNYSVIRSPISGVVVARDVNVGQTVAANFQTPTLFQIARDLRQMQINISVAEADIGQIHIEQPIAFSVDAFPEHKFSAVVKQIRLNPTIQENVVTYNVVATVFNEDGSLLPGMTANVRFIVAEKPEVLRIPNAALRYKPAQDKMGGSISLQPGYRLVYRLDNNLPAPIQIRTGITDGKLTEVLSGELAENDLLVIEAISARQKNDKPASNIRFRMF
ncbi:MAG: efflux RND transporter periplasmic adaptor subunit [Nitrosomonas sp.]|jgi:HlyD family secretion protein|nr:efflux RND transporter periplasmic adaptor subunit [Nitrosomonas sp.]